MKKPVSVSILLAAYLLALVGCVEADDPAPAAAPAAAAGKGAAGSPAVPGAAGGAAGTVATASGAAMMGPLMGQAGGGAAATASATIAPLMGQTLSGTATFSSSSAGVMLQLAVQNCPPGDHPFHIHQGSACTDMMTQGAHWDGDGTPEMPTRGEMITPITCQADMTGMVNYTRPATAPANMAWTIGGDPASNVKGHVIVIHMSSTDKARLACGVIN
jgi:Cu/Zn superoxide dismutase